MKFLKQHLAHTLAFFSIWIFWGTQVWANPLANCSLANPSGCVTKNVSGKTQKGFTLIDIIILPAVGLPGETILIDSDGNIVNSWITGAWSKMLPGGNILTNLYYSDWSPLQQQLDCIVELDWDGNLVWPPNANIIDTPIGRFCDSSAQIVTTGLDIANRPVTRLHHDSQREGNPVGYPAPGQRAIAGGGKTLFIAADFPDLADTTHISDHPLYNDKIYEFAADGTTILWDWDPIDHLEAGQGSPGDLGLGFSNDARQAIKIFQLPSFDVRHPDKSDWLHFNSVSYVGKNHWCPNENSAACDLRFHPENVLWNSREANITAIVARNDHPNGDWLSGDIVWRVGPDIPTILGKLDQVIGSHMVYIIPRGLKGAGNILLFDNGGASGYGVDSNGDPAIKIHERTYSRVIEFDPITLDIIWLYERPDSIPLPGENFAPFSSLFISGAQRLKNGNTLITEGQSGRIFEVDRLGRLVWEFVSPFGPIAPPPVPPLGGNAVYRAYRVPKNWVPKNR